MITPSSPTQPPTSPNKKKKKKLTMPMATVIAGITGLIGAGISGGVTYATQHDAAAVNPASSAPAPTPVPAVLKINQPASGDIQWKDNYSGQAQNLQVGQIVWIFAQVVTDNRYSTTAYPEIGPCTVNYTKSVWTCTGIYIGKKPPKSDNKTYEVCAAIIDTDLAHTIVSALSAGTPASLPLSDVPSIHDGTSSCMSVRRI